MASSIYPSFTSKFWSLLDSSLYSNPAYPQYAAPVSAWQYPTQGWGMYSAWNSLNSLYQGMPAMSTYYTPKPATQVAGDISGNAGTAKLYNGRAVYSNGLGIGFQGTQGLFQAPKNTNPYAFLIPRF